MNNANVLAMGFAKLYPLYVAKAEKKGRAQTEVDEIIAWLTGYDSIGIAYCLEQNIDLATFLNNAPRMNPNRQLITGSVCGVKLSEITDPMMLSLRQLDKLVDELAKGKSLDKICRKGESK